VTVRTPAIVCGGIAITVEVLPMRPFIRGTLALAASGTLALAGTATAVAASAGPHAAGRATATPIKHLVVIFQENISFDHVVDRLRHSLALQYVKQRHLSLAQIAWLLGYEGPTSFNSAFSRWTGRSASEVRNEKPQLVPPQQ